MFVPTATQEAVRGQQASGMIVVGSPQAVLFLGAFDEMVLVAFGSVYSNQDKISYSNQELL